MTIDKSEEDTVAVDIRDRIAWVKFNRPEKRNCMNPKLSRQMMRVLGDGGASGSISGMVLDGS